MKARLLTGSGDGLSTLPWLPLACVVMSAGGSGAFSQQSTLPDTSSPPTIPIGLDAYRQWDRLPYQRIGIRAFMRCTYDREGNNRSADASHFLYQEAEDFNVTLDVKGPGTLYFKRCNHWHGSPWHYEIDGRDTIVSETATSDPVSAKQNVRHATFLPERLFPHPLTWNWTTTHGADLMWVPLTYEDSLRLAYSRTAYGTGYYIYHQYPLGIEHISRPLESWQDTPPDADVLELLNRSGTDIGPSGADVSTFTGTLTEKDEHGGILTEISSAPAMIRAIRFIVPREVAQEFGKSRLRITWDDRPEASIDAPIDLFFGCGQLYNNDNREYLVKGFPINVRYERDIVHLACYWPMPFFKNARIELAPTDEAALAGVQWEVRTVPFDGPRNHVAYFHATYSDHPDPVAGQDLTILDTSKLEGSTLWSGHFVGMSWIFSRRGVLNTLEGDPRFFFDDSQTPQAHGTGTEEWGGGGDYWGGRNMTIPLAGHPVGRGHDQTDQEADLLNSAYRFLIADIFPFGRRAVITLEHGGVNDSREHYSSVAYWYGIDAPSLIPTDEVDVCDEDSAAEHSYSSPTAEDPYLLSSRFDGWGPDSPPREKESENAQSDQLESYFPEYRAKVRTMKGASQFVVRLEPRNLGVLLRRQFDYQYPNQLARVYVRKAGSGGEWQYVGQWYTAGSNTCVYSNPLERPVVEGIHPELSPAGHLVITSNRRWREDEFLIAQRYTEGVENLEIKIVHVPNEKELFPGHPFPAPSAWSEGRYWVFCYQLPML